MFPRDGNSGTVNDAIDDVASYAVDTDASVAFPNCSITLGNPSSSPKFPPRTSMVDPPLVDAEVRDTEVMKGGR